jgi:hypothetical protein
MLQSQIPQMARIYEQGIFTIVAAAADNADNGLAGVRPGTRTIIKDMITLHNLSLIVAPVPPHLDHGEQMVLDVRGHSRFGAFRWRSRAWTLQEELFSRRRLYFGADRLLWQCPCGFYQKETVKEVPAACVSNHQRGELLDIDPWLTSTIMDIHFDFVLYEHLVSEYSRRRLSFVSDTLSAMAGLYEEISKKYQIRFIWGHPDIWFLESLFRRTHYECVRNEGTHRTTGAMGEEIATPFPSWSWSAWVGNLEDNIVNYPGSSSNTSYKSNPAWFKVLVYRCRLDDQLGLVPYSCINTSDLSKYQHSMRDNSAGNRAATMPDKWVGAPRHIILPASEEPAVVVDSGHLQFWTSVAKLYIACEDSKEIRRAFCYEILNSNGEVILGDVNMQSTVGLDWDDTARYQQYPPAIISLSKDFKHGIHEIHAVVLRETEPSHPDNLLGVSILLVVETNSVFYRRGTLYCSCWQGLDTKWALVTLG